MILVFAWKMKCEYTEKVTKNWVSEKCNILLELQSMLLIHKKNRSVERSGKKERRMSKKYIQDAFW